jgi:outer membrane protein assembly factor BamB
MNVATLSMVLCALSATVMQAANWPSWRGPNQDNSTTESKFPLEWNATKNRKWRVALPEAGNSSPIVWGNRVFLTQAVNDGKHRSVMCFDRASGQILWQKGVDFEAQDPRHKTNPHCAATPVTDGERVVASFASAGIVSYDFQGRELWRTDLGPQRHEWGQGSSPVIHGDLVIVYHGPGPNSALYALDKQTGAKKWRVELKESHPLERFDGFKGQTNGAIGTFATPLMVTAGGRSELVLPVMNRLRAWSPETGKELWSCDGMNPLVYSSPTFGEGRIVAMGGFFGSVIYIKPGGSGDVTANRLAYTQRMTKHCIGSPIIKDGHVYLSVTDGFVQCFELATAKLLWEERLKASGSDPATWASMVLAGDRLYVPNRSGDTIVLRAAPKFEVLATNPVGELSNSTLAFSEGDVFLRTHEALWCIGETKAPAN